MDEFLILFVLLLVGGAILFFWFRGIDRGAAKQDAQQGERWAEVAVQQGWRVLPEAEHTAVAAYLAPFHIASRPGGRIKNVLAGTGNGAQLFMIDYETGSPPNSRFSQEHTLALFVDEGLALPPFLLAWRWAQSKSIALPAHPAFTANFALISDEPEAVQALFTADLVAFCKELATDAARIAHTRMEGNGRCVLLYRSEKYVDELLPIFRAGQELHRQVAAAASS